MTIDHPFKNIVENETSHICDHYERMNIVDMSEDRGILEGTFSELQAALEFILNLSS